MANYATLKGAIQDVVKTNGNNEITGALLQQSLLAMINSLGANFQYAGIATPSTNPGTPDQNVFYIASTSGTYTNFGGIVLADGEIAILKYNGNWSKDSTGVASMEMVDNLAGAKLEEYNAIAGAEIATYDFPVDIKSGETVTLTAKTDGAVINTFRVYANQAGTTAVMENANSTVQFTAQEDINKFVVYIRNVTVSGKVKFEVDFGIDFSLKGAFNKIEEITYDVSEILGAYKINNQVSVNPETIYVTFPIPTIKAGHTVRVVTKSENAVIQTFRVYGNAAAQNQVNIASVNDESFYTPAVDVNSFVVRITNCTNAGNVEISILENNGIVSNVDYVNNRINEMPDCYGRVIDLVFQAGYFRYDDGASVGGGTSYKNSVNLLPVNEGDTFVFLTDAGTSVAVVAAYDKNNIYQKQQSLPGTGTYMAVKYVVPAGIRKIRFTLSASENFTPFVTQVYKAKCGETDSINTGIYQKENIILTNGVPVQLDGINCHKTNWIIEANFRGLSGFTNILVGKGLNENIAHGGMWLNITPSTVAPAYSTGAYPGVNHGLTITDYLDVRIESFVDKTDESEGATGDGDATYIRYTLFDGTKQFILEKVFFLGSEQPFIQVNGTNSAKADLFYWCTDLKNELWCYGDSYFSIAQTRWPYWVLTRGFNALFNGMPGANSEYMWKRFCNDLICGNPRKVFWCLGMNDVESGAMNTNWKRFIDRVIDICELRGIEPILCTIPNTPAYDNTYKNNYVKSLSYKYIDFDKAVKNSSGTGWINGMMQDNIHPNKNGAKCLANAAMKLFISKK